ncbi:MAG: peptidase, partial [Myxococcota bacterium]
MQRFYPIGTPGEPWTARDRAQWAAQQTAQRSYADEVLAELEQITPAWARAKYGALSVDPDRYPLWCARPAQPDP